jgi:sugar phosphate isomerase/epimerase
MAPKLAVSTVSLPGIDAVGAFRSDCRAALGRELLFELSYQWEAGSPEQAPEVRGAVLSVHAPCPRAPHFPNLGSRDASVLRRSLEDIRRSAETAARFGAGFVVLHPGYTLDVPVPVDATRRLAVLSRHAGEEARYIWSREGSICTPGYCESPGYRVHLEEATANLAEAARRCAAEGVELAVENLNPRVSYLLQLPAEIVQLVRALPRLRVCVDLGHLWIASLVHRFDFLRGLRQIVDTGRVVSAHVHDNGSQLGTRTVAGRLVDAPPDGSYLGDDHLAIGRGRVPVAAAVQLLARAGVGSLVVETHDPPLESVRRLAAMVGRAGSG